MCINNKNCNKNKKKSLVYSNEHSCRYLLRFFFLDITIISCTALNIEMKIKAKLNFDQPLSWDNGRKYILQYKFY